jgi:NitT/TauT family transport system ATP-binding protein
MIRPVSRVKQVVRLVDVGMTYSARGSQTVALAGMNLDIHHGEFLSVLGPSGCGKSTLLRCVAGLEKNTSGTIYCGDKVLDGPPDRLGVVFQRDVLLDWLTILDNVLLVAGFRNKLTPAHTAAALALLERFGLKESASRHPWELSGGMRQRAAICRALLDEPELLLMDEPFGALDAMTRDDLNLELARLWQDKQKSILFITHSINEAVFLSDRIVIMDRNPGRIIETIEIDLPRPRALAVRESVEFGQYSRHIRQVFASLGIMKE